MIAVYQSMSPIFTSKATKILRIILQKTCNEVMIPIMSNNLQAICKKYNYHLPPVVDKIINRYIKEIVDEIYALVAASKRD